MVKAFVTGATGRIGRVLVKELVEKGIQVKALTRDQNSAMLLPKGVEAVYGKLSDSGVLEQSVKDVDFVFHLAAVVGERLDYQTMRKINVEGTENLLNACSKAKIQRFVHVSSIAVYGRKLEEMPCTEKAKKNPYGRYGKTKLEAEKVVEGFFESVPCTIVRPGVVYGKGFDEGYMQIIRMLEKGKMPVIGSGKNRIPFVHVDDVVRAIILASEKVGATENAFNVCSNETITQEEIYSIVCSELKVAEPKKRVPLILAKTFAAFYEIIDSLRGRAPKITPDHVDVIASDRVYSIEKARKILGFEPKVSLREGIKEMVQYYKEGDYASRKN